MDPQTEQNQNNQNNEFNIKQPNRNKLSIKLDLRILIFVLLAVIAGMLIIWKPWTSSKYVEDKTINVTGEATLQATPDEYVFRPHYQFKNASKDVALAESTAKSNEIVAKLKTLGVSENKIKTSSTGYDSSSYSTAPKTSTYNLSITVTVNDAALAQKVQDYLLTTSPTGSVSPDASFSDSKRKSLESQARDEATKDAKTKADQMAKNLKFKVGKVKSVEVDSGFDDYYSLNAGADMSSADKVGVTDDSANLSYRIQPGENDLYYAVSVTYYIR